MFGSFDSQKNAHNLQAFNDRKYLPPGKRTDSPLASSFTLHPIKMMILGHARTFLS